LDTVLLFERGKDALVDLGVDTRDTANHGCKGGRRRTRGLKEKEGKGQTEREREKTYWA
jgi:hypothetical protein